MLTEKEIKEHRKLSERKYYEKNRDVILARSKEYNKTEARIKYSKEYRKKHHKELLEYERKYQLEHKEHYKNLRLEIKREVMEHYGGVCSCCGEKRVEFLTINHSNGDGAEHREKLFGPRYSKGVRKATSGGGTRFYYWLRRNNYPEGFNVLCYNCNCALGFFGYCPHEKEK